MKKVLFLIIILLINLCYSIVFANEKNLCVYKKTIAIDLDGVLDNYNGKYDENIFSEIKDGAKEFIIELSKNYKLILFTTRNSKQAKEWLLKNKIDKYFSDVTNIKPLAYIYIDDRALKFDGDYNQTLSEIKNYKVYWK